MKELQIQLPSGGILMCGPGTRHKHGGDVKILDSDGSEVAYWESSEWRDDPESVMGAIFGCALSLCKGCGLKVCEGCEGTGVRADGDNGLYLKPPEGFVIVERCDCCERYENDVAAAAAWGDDAQWQDGLAERKGVQAIARPRNS